MCVVARRGRELVEERRMLDTVRGDDTMSVMRASVSA